MAKKLYFYVSIGLLANFIVSILPVKAQFVSQGSSFENQSQYYSEDPSQYYSEEQQMCLYPTENNENQKNNTPPSNNDNQLFLYEIDGEARPMTKRKYDALMMKKRVDGLKNFKSPGGAFGYLISRMFTDDPDQGLRAAEAGRVGFDVFTAPFDRDPVSHYPNRHSSSSTRTTICSSR